MAGDRSVLRVFLGANSNFHDMKNEDRPRNRIHENQNLNSIPLSEALLTSNVKRKRYSRGRLGR